MKIKDNNGLIISIILIITSITYSGLLAAGSIPQENFNVMAGATILAFTTGFLWLGLILEWESVRIVKKN